VQFISLYLLNERMSFIVEGNHGGQRNRASLIAFLPTPDS
jgi:hypothetical protein